MRLIVLLYILIGDATANRFTGRYLIIDRSSVALIVGGNIIAIMLFVVGLSQAGKRGKFLGFDRGLWAIATVGCYVLGFILNAYFGGRNGL